MNFLMWTLIQGMWLNINKQHCRKLVRNNYCLTMDDWFSLYFNSENPWNCIMLRNLIAVEKPSAKGIHALMVDVTRSHDQTHTHTLSLFKTFLPTPCSSSFASSWLSSLPSFLFFKSVARAFTSFFYSGANMSSNGRWTGLNRVHTHIVTQIHGPNHHHSNWIQTLRILFRRIHGHAFPQSLPVTQPGGDVTMPLHQPQNGQRIRLYPILPQFYHPPCPTQTLYSFYQWQWIRVIRNTRPQAHQPYSHWTSTAGHSLLDARWYEWWFQRT